MAREYLAPLLPYAALLTVLVGVVSGVLTYLQWRRARYLTAAAELVRTVQTPEFAHSIQLILELPVNASPDLVLSNREMVLAAYVVGHAFESLGVMVFHRLLPLNLVDHLIGGYVRASWARLGPYVAQQRSRLGAMFGEWFQWLAERLLQHPARSKDVGAAIAHRNWRP